ncbi:MAG: GatB/YqeY domain-containing protein [Candidatus Obscuribacterales bacterium]|nr:GatB/YqeY domain-containing protein [Candidatus Obscuribacterales bacterium]
MIAEILDIVSVKGESMSLKEKISEDLKVAMKAREQVKVDTLRSVLSAFTYKKTELKRDINDQEEIDVLVKLVKQRNDSIDQFSKAGRTELAEKESLEKEIISAYLPAQKSEDEIKQIVKDIIAGLGEGERNQGMVMKAAMPKLKGLADGNLVKKIVSELLSG